MLKVLDFISQVKPQRHPRLLRVEVMKKADIFEEEEVSAKAEYLEGQRLIDEAHKYYEVFALTWGFKGGPGAGFKFSVWLKRQVQDLFDKAIDKLPGQ